MTLDDLAAICIGSIGLSPPVFWDCTFKELAYAIEGYRRREDSLLREQWNQTRIIAYHSAAAYGGTKPLGSIYKFMPYPWDIKSADVMDVDLKGDERKAMMEKLKQNVKIQSQLKT